MWSGSLRTRSWPAPPSAASRVRGRSAHERLEREIPAGRVAVHERRPAPVRVIGEAHARRIRAVTRVFTEMTVFPSTDAPVGGRRAGRGGAADGERGGERVTGAHCNAERTEVEEPAAERTAGERNRTAGGGRNLQGTDRRYRERHSAALDREHH